MNVLLGEIFFIAGLLSQYRVDASFVLQDTFSDSLNEHFANLSQFNDTSCPFETGVMMQEMMSDLLAVTAINIQKEPGYRLPFIANCSVFFDSKIDQIICDTEFANVQTLLSYEGNMPLPATEASFLHKGNILKTSMVVGLEPLQHPQVLYWLYFKLPPTQTESQTNLLSLTITPSITITDSNSDSRSTSAMHSKTQSITIHKSETLTKSATTSLDFESQSLSKLSTASETNTIMSSVSTSLSHTGTSSLTLSKSFTQTPSVSLSFSDEASISQSCSVPPLQNVTMWSPLAYAEATNQDRRYLVACSIVIDTFTNLMWEQSSTPGLTWNTTAVPESAQVYCQGLTKGGHADWRVPNIVELQSLVDYTLLLAGPMINGTAFPVTSTSYYWTSLPVAGSVIPWYMSFGSIGIYGGLICSVYFNGAGQCAGVPAIGDTRCVRGMSINPTTRYTDENDAPLTGGSTQIKDQVTGLIWQRSQAPSTYTWTQAISYCSTTLTLGSQIWRLPTGKELETLVDYKISPPGPMINVTAFPSTLAGGFWSSSPVAGVAGFACVVCVRCVR